MADVTAAQLQGLYINWSNLFQKNYLKVEPMYPKIVQELSSDTETETYAWMDRFPGLRKWQGPRFVNSVVTRSYSLTGFPYEGTVEISKWHVKFNKIDLYKPTVESLAMEARLWPDDLVFSASSSVPTGVGVMYNGENVTTFDGSHFFDANHPVDPENPTAYPVQPNYYSTGMDLNGANGFQNFQTVYQNMRQLRGRDAHSLRIKPNVVVVPPQLRGAALNIVEPDLVATAVNQMAATGSSRNIYEGIVDVVVADQLQDDPTSWYLLDTTKPIRPFIFQLSQAPQFAMRVNPTDEPVWDRAMFQYGVDAFGAAGYGLWHCAAKARA